MRNMKKTLSFYGNSLIPVLPILILAGCGGGGFSLLGPSDKQTLNDLRVLDREDRTEVVLRGEEPIDYTFVSLANPPRVIVNFPELSKGDVEGNIKVGKGNVQKINIEDGQGSRGSVRMEIMLKQAARPNVREENNALVFAFPLPKETDAQKVVDEYRIGPEDVLEVMVWKNEELTRTVSVRPDGKISLPLVGDIKASGLSTKQLNNLITDRLKEYLTTPEVSVLVKDIKSYYFYILGEVANPGKYPLKESTTLLQAISMAGGFTPFASKNGLAIFRKDPLSSIERKLQVKYKDIISAVDANKNYSLMSGDTVVVP